MTAASRFTSVALLVFRESIFLGSNGSISESRTSWPTRVRPRTPPTLQNISRIERSKIGHSQQQRNSIMGRPKGPLRRVKQLCVKSKEVSSHADHHNLSRCFR